MCSGGSTACRQNLLQTQDCELSTFSVLAACSPLRCCPPIHPSKGKRQRRTVPWSIWPSGSHCGPGALLPYFNLFRPLFFDCRHVFPKAITLKSRPTFVLTFILPLIDTCHRVRFPLQAAVIDLLLISILFHHTFYTVNKELTTSLKPQGLRRLHTCILTLSCLLGPLRMHFPGL